MTKSTKTLEFKIERTIAAPPAEVFDAWFDSQVPGTVWNAADKFVLDPKVDGLFYWTFKGTAHYGRFTTVEPAIRIQHTWMSPHTAGVETMVTVTFEKHGDETLMTLLHAGLPDTDPARGHEGGWNYFMGIFADQFGAGTRKPYRWEESHPDAVK